MSNCIECRKPKEAHAADGACPWEYKTKYSTMDLPTGYTCADCKFFGFCSKFIGPQIETNTTCDWFPIRFNLKPPERPAA